MTTEPCSKRGTSRLSFGRTPALRGASVTIQPARCWRSWVRAGRASRRCCTAWPGILVPDSGEVRFAGQSRRHDRARPSAASCVGGDFGFVFQFGQLVPELTAEENVALPLLLNGVSRRGARTRRRGWFDRLDLGGMETAPRRRAVGRPGTTSRAGPRAGRQARCRVRRRADRIARLARRRAGDGTAGRHARGIRAPRWFWSPTSRASPPMPIGRSSFVTGQWRRWPRSSDDPPRTAARRRGRP